MTRNVGTGTFTLAVSDSVNMSVDLSYGDAVFFDTLGRSYRLGLRTTF